MKYIIDIESDRTLRKIDSTIFDFTSKDVKKHGM